MKKVIVYLTVLAMMLALCGCFGEPAPSTEPSTQPTTEPTIEPTTEPTTVPTEPPAPDAGDIAAALKQATEGRAVTAATMKMVMDYGFHIAVQGFEMDIGMAVDSTMEMIMSQEPYAGYARLTANIATMGMNMEESAESYLTVEDGVPVQYTYTVSEDIWTRSDAGSFDSSPTLGLDLLNEIATLTLDEDPQILNERKAWVLRCELTMDQAAKLTGNVNGSNDLLASAGLEDDVVEYLKVLAAIYVDTETNLPLQIDLAFQGLEEYLMDTMFDPETAAPGQETSVEVGEFSMVLTGLSFDPQEIPPVPQAAYDYVAMSSHDPDQGDGTYLLINSDTAVLVTTPAGWEGFASNFNSVEFNTEDYSYWVGFTLYANVTLEDMEAQFNEQVTFYRDIEDYAAHGIEDLEGYRVGWIEDIYGYTRYFAWTQMGTGCLYLTIDDYENADMAQLLTPLLQAAEYQEPIA